jgi:hypothetical protein
MLRGGPEHWSNECARAQVVQVAGVPRTQRFVVRCLIVAIAAGAILAGAFEGRLACAQLGQQPSVSVAPILRAEPASRVRLPIQVRPAGALAKNSFIRIRGLPPSAALSDGYSIAAGTWAVPLVALPTLSVILPTGLQGESSVAITLVSVEGEILAETSMVLTVSLPVPEPTPLGQAFRPNRAGAAPQPQSSSERERVLGLHAKGIEQLERGNVVAARKFFERAVEGGLAQSAVALAGTHDPDELAKMKVVGLQPNIEEARRWYEKARELGAFEAAERLRRLGAR